ncbi:MAG: hypothetical protein H7X95_02590 [Deltaproteobacteria bacterium]|nr:hypothetical protein [Deltaproteobacteria bacterium]
MGDAAWLDDGSANGLWVMGGGNAQRRYSTDAATTWQRLPVGTLAHYRRLASGGARAAATADMGLSFIQTAPGQTPPLTWTDHAIAGITEPSLAMGAGGVAVAVWWDTACHYFSGAAWRACTLARAPRAITSVVNDGTSFLVLGRDPPYVSTNGMTYTQSATTAGTDFRQVRFGGGIYVAPDIKQWSMDGIAWRAMTTPPTFTVTDVEVGTLGACP